MSDIGDKDLLFNLQILNKQMEKCIKLLKISNLLESDKKARELEGANYILKSWCDYIQKQL